MKFKHQLFFGNFLVIFIMACIALLLLFYGRELHDSSEWVKRTHYVLENANELAKTMVDMETGQRGFMLTGNEDFLEPYLMGKNAFQKTMTEILFLVKDNSSQVARLAEIEALQLRWKGEAGEYEINLKRRIMKGEMSEQALIHVLEGKATDGSSLSGQGRQSGKQIMDTIRFKLERFKTVEKELLKSRVLENETLYNNMIRVGMVGTLVTVLLALFLTSYLTKRLMSQLGVEPMEVERIAKELAEGQLAARVPEELINGTDNVAVSLNGMAQAMEESLALLEDRSWVDGGRSGLADELRGILDESTVAGRSITFLCKHLKAQMGALYLAYDGGILRLTGSYAYTRRNHEAQNIAIGEGSLGQAALENNTILLCEVPESYTPVASGLGHAVPKNVLIVPFSMDRELYGLVEMCSFQSFSDAQIAFVESVGESLAMAIKAARDRSVAELLAKTQQQAEELQTQQEELKSSNEELELQTQTLRRSEESLTKQKVDIIEQNRELEQTKRFLQEKARELEMADKYKSEFLSNMSHEIRTPLNSMLILSKSLADNKDGNLTPNQVEDASIVYSGGVDLLHLINEILDLSKVEAGKMALHVENVRLTNLFSTLQKQFSAIADKKGLKFITEQVEGVPEHIRSDGQRLSQILRNLLSNALKFTEQGSVTLTVSRPSGSIQLRNHDAADEVVAFTVEDTGMGIPEEKRHAIFEAFQQADGSTSRTHGGTGLGLTISRKLAHLLGGVLQLEPASGRGSKFTLYLPASIEAGEQVAEAEKSESTLSSSRLDEAKRIAPITDTGETHGDDRVDISPNDRSILIIEDDQHFVHILGDFARKRGYKVLLSRMGKDGLVLAERYLPSAIILDLGLPDIDGRSVLVQLKYSLTTRHIPVHIISAREKENEIMQKGAMGFLTKPANSEDLDQVFAKLETHLSKGVREVLVIEDDKGSQAAIKKLIEHKGVVLTLVQTGKQALEKLAVHTYDCLILDLTLPDMSGFEIVDQLPTLVNPPPPIIVYTGRELSLEEREQLTRCTSSVVLKGVGSPERLVDDLALFLHSIETSLPASQREILQGIHDPKHGIKGHTVLIVDDDMRNIFALGRVLTDMGLNVESADNGLLGLEKLEEDPDIDLVLMDIMMPVMDGLETMRRIRAQERYADLPIIAITAKAMPEDKAKSMAAGANDYLTKPVDIPQLTALLRMWLHKA